LVNMGQTHLLNDIVMGRRLSSFPAPTFKLFNIGYSGFLIELKFLNRRNYANMSLSG
jgi:hypothetical protein